MLNESDTSEPMFSEWLLAEVNWSSPFSITTERPKVTSSVVSMLRSQGRLEQRSLHDVAEPGEDRHHHEKRPDGGYMGDAR